MTWTKISEKDTCPQDCAASTSCNSNNLVLLGYDAMKVRNGICPEDGCDNLEEHNGVLSRKYYEIVPKYKVEKVSANYNTF